MQAHSTKGKYLPKTKKHTKKIILIAAAVLILAVAMLLPRLLGKNNEQPLLDLADTTILTYTDLRSTVSATGTVESAESTMVYSTAAYPVMAVHVEVGDVVQAGDLLAELDDHSIRNQITSQEISLDLSAQNSNQQLQAAQDTYDNFKSGLDQGLNSTLNSARNQAESAYEAYEKAQLTYDRYAESLAVGENTTLINADAAYRTAQETYETARETHRQLFDSYDTAANALQEAETQLRSAETALTDTKLRQDTIGLDINNCSAELAELSGIQEENRTPEQTARMAELELQLSALQAEKEQLVADRVEQELAVYMLQSVYSEANTAFTQLDAQLTSAEKAVTQAERALETQRATYNATVTTVDNTLADYLTNVQTAWDTYQDALTALASTEKSVKEQLQSYENNLTSAQINTNKASAEESLRQLQENLDDTQITAPVSGTITAIYAEVGGSGSGLLFVIEDVDNLIVDTAIKGYDVGTVQTGMKVLIRSDATGSAELDGILTSIAPTSTKNAMGKSDTNGDAMFAAEVEITSKDTGLRIGMEAQLDYIVAEAHQVLAVPYDAVYTDDAGQTCILVADDQGDNRYLIRSVPVTTGMDDDLDLVVSGPGVVEGLLVINEADAYLDLLGQTVTAGTGLHSDLMSAMMGG